MIAFIVMNKQRLNLICYACCESMHSSGVLLFKSSVLHVKGKQIHVNPSSLITLDKQHVSHQGIKAAYCSATRSTNKQLQNDTAN